MLRRLDCVLEATKAQVLDRGERLWRRVANIEPVLCSSTGRAQLLGGGVLFISRRRSRAWSIAPAIVFEPVTRCASATLARSRRTRCNGCLGTGTTERGGLDAVIGR